MIRAGKQHDESPQGWVLCRLEDLVTKIANGITQRQRRDGIGIPVTRIETIANEKVNLERVGYLQGLSQETIAKYRLLPSDILFSHINSDSHLGKTALVNLTGITLLHGMNLLLLRPNTETIKPNFLNYQLKWLRYSGHFISVAQHAVNQSSINQRTLKETPTLLPPLVEQERIVAKIEELFSRLDAGVAALEKIRIALKRYRQSVLKHAFEGKLTAKWREENKDKIEPAQKMLTRIRDNIGKNAKTKLTVDPTIDPSTLYPVPEEWCWAKLRDIADIKGGITKDQKRRFSNGRIVPYLRVANVQRGYLDLSEVKTIEASEEIISDLSLRKGDILFTEGGDRDKLGRGCIWKEEIPECIHQNHIFRARLCTNDMSNKLVSWYGNTFGQIYFMKEGKQTTNLASINLTKLRNFPVPVIPKLEQEILINEVELRLSIADEIERAIVQSQTQSSKLRQSILKRAFGGKLVPQDPSDEPAAQLLERIETEKATLYQPKGKRKKMTKRRSSGQRYQKIKK